MAVVDEQEDPQDEDAQFGAFPEGEQQRQGHEDTELAEHIGRCGGRAGRPDLILSQQQGHGQPEQQEISQEPRDALATEIGLDGGQRLFPWRIGRLRMQVQARQEDGAGGDLEKPQNVLLHLLFGDNHVVRVRLQFDILPFRGFDKYLCKGVPAGAGLYDRRQEGEDRIEDQQRRKGGQVLFMPAALDIVPHQIAGTEDEVGEGPLGILVQKRNERFTGAHIHAATLLFLFRLPPGYASRFEVDPEQAPPRHHPRAEFHVDIFFCFCKDRQIRRCFPISSVYFARFTSGMTPHLRKGRANMHGLSDYLRNSWAIRSDGGRYRWPLPWR